MIVYLSLPANGKTYVTGDVSVATQNGNGFRRFQGIFTWHNLFNTLIATPNVDKIVIQN